MANIFHVAKSGSDANPGTADKPFVTINAASIVANPADTIIVHEGEYRECVNPRRGGLSNTRRITYQAAKGEKVVIKGSERIQSWEIVSESVWKAVLPNSFFGDFNPYKEPLIGDWLIYPTDRQLHLGDVYLNGMSFYEAASIKELDTPKTKSHVTDHWTGESVPVPCVNQTKYLWFSEVTEDETTIYANFFDADPNKELVEINVRMCCFYPKKVGTNYITIRGFEIAQAATPWTPPTSDQVGMVGPNWSLGWIIEDNILHDAKCSAISIGKEASTGENERTYRKDKPGYQYQLEAVFKAYKIGWSKEKIGSHIIRNNTIYDCGQNGIVGHLGCVFCEIYGNHIYNIALKREWFGWEVGGIKLHAAIDVHIHNNKIHDCSMGTWLDWQAQGSRVSKNLFYRNNIDLFIEVSHGPTLVDHNILGSKYAIKNDTQGVAFVRNLIAGRLLLGCDNAGNYSKDRSTPYHTPHSTDISGFSATFGGDDRYYQNIFVGDGDKAQENIGTALFEAYPTSLEAYIKAVDTKSPCDHDVFFAENQPVYLGGNVYLNEAKPSAKEKEKLDMQGFDPSFSIEEKDNEIYLNITLPKGFEQLTSAPHNTNSLGRVRIQGANFENPDGTDLYLNSDFFGNTTNEKTVSGPISNLKDGKNHIPISAPQSLRA